MSRYYLGIGANLGDRAGHLRDAIEWLDEAGTVVAVSGLYRSAPIGPEQPEFLNAAVALESDLSPYDLLSRLHAIEDRLGRHRGERWGPRTIDIDILAGPELVESDTLDLPHPRWAERRFVVDPLSEVFESDVAGIDARSIESARRETSTQDVERLADPNWAAGTDRGGGWVSAQVVVFAVVFGLALLTPDTFTGSGWRWAGRVLVVAGAVLMVGGVRSLGRSLTAFPEPAEAATLQTTGVYAHVRHPIYGAVVLGLLGVAVHQRSWPAIVAALAAGGFFWKKAEAEERRLCIRYPDYAAYRASVPGRILPWVR